MVTPESLIQTGPGAEPARWGLRQYFLGNVLLGQLRHYSVRTNNNAWGFEAHKAFCCPVCGEIWGRVIFLPHREWNPGHRLSWLFETRACPKHGNGSLLTSVPELNSITEVSFLRHEALVAVRGNLPPLYP